ncbi:hypothetical protein BDV26DRAFT_254885 [Aspergillus bertholletiae]|uniref:Uncharacterized protein n=1 Tax=Aspergillus bertholletiae TaxID=1226010 RepID=A0A5N7BIV1_9EURO|nr:hypothetical protein BDV26DRAFT_254885 [Aspergillus bertholletiae]
MHDLAETANDIIILCAIPPYESLEHLKIHLTLYDLGYGLTFPGLSTLIYIPLATSCTTSRDKLQPSSSHPAK